MKWLAQLKIQERGRAVALKEAAAVQQCEKKLKKTKKNPKKTKTHHLHIRMLVPHTESML